MITTNTGALIGLYVNSTLSETQEPIYVDFYSTVNKYVLVLFCEKQIL